MSLAETIAAVLRDELRCHTAWPPIGTPLGLGDYGSVDGGLFHKDGNVSEIPVAFKSETGADVRLNFTSADTTVTRVNAGAEVTAFPEGGINASIKINFNSANAVMLKAGKITVRSIANIAQVAKALKRTPDWKRSNAVVGAVLIAEGPLLLGTRAAGTEVTFGGDTSALKALELGQLNANLSFAKNKELGLEVVGKSGVLGVRLFTLHFWGDEPKHLGARGGAGSVDEEYMWLLPPNLGS